MYFSAVSDLSADLPVIGLVSHWLAVSSEGSLFGCAVSKDGGRLLTQMCRGNVIVGLCRCLSVTESGC